MRLEIKNLSVGYTDPILKGITIVVERGEGINFYGPNGIGKTTLLKTISTYLKPLRGEILYDGIPIEKVKGKIFFLPEEIHVPIKVRAEEYLKAITSLYGANVDKDGITRALESVGVLNPKRKLGELSQGTIRRVQLASTLLVNAEIIRS
ncbi:ABC transporter ATP-binding protein [Pyrococcus yayanosii]|uniref:Putative ABC transporter n=1 Tax=Pyrococcus yayanosii (strain CH1 / JCM 16557) TaxID=529709 RepID=F8AJ80_PYRYC|nr:ATP-binding cassette domain-containing protein [Pyrococcus yayanosii]AEH24521.1 putative ABC transporter [Pyrococcus yayanosii CH1]